MKTLCIGHDQAIATWAFDTFRVYPCHYVMAIGVVENDRLIGAAIFQAHNGPDVELSYYGPNSLTLDVVKKLAKIAVDYLGVSRITARTARSNKTVTRGIKKIGFEYEGIRHCGYGNQDAVMYGLYGEKLARLSGKAMH